MTLCRLEGTHLHRKWSSSTLEGFISVTNMARKAGMKRKSDEYPPGYDPEFEAQMERIRKESGRLNLDWYATEAILENRENNPETE